MDYHRQNKTRQLPSIACPVGLATIALYCLAISSPCRAGATLQQRIDPPAIHLGDTAKISIAVKDGGWTRLLQLPKVADATVLRLGEESFEGTQEHPVVVSNFAIMPSHTGEFTIPGFDVKTQDREILHVQPMTVEVFNVGQNIPAKYLQQASPPSLATPSPATGQTLTIISATTGQVEKVIHYSPAGIPIDEVPSPSGSVSNNAPQPASSQRATSTDTNAAPGATTATATQLDSPPQAVVSRPSLATVPLSPAPSITGQSPPAPVAEVQPQSQNLTANSGTNQGNSTSAESGAAPVIVQARGTVLQRVDKGYLINAKLITPTPYLWVENPEKTYFVLCENPTLVDDDPFSAMVCVTNQTASYENVQGAECTVRVLNFATEDQVAQLRRTLDGERQVAQDNETEMLWALDPRHHRYGEYFLKRSLAEAIKNMSGLTGPVTLDMIRRAHQGDAGAADSISSNLSPKDKEVLLTALREAKFE